MKKLLQDWNEFLQRPFARTKAHLISRGNAIQCLLAIKCCYLMVMIQNVHYHWFYVGFQIEKFAQIAMCNYIAKLNHGSYLSFIHFLC